MQPERDDDAASSTLARQVAVDILVNGSRSRAGLAELLGVSAATVTRLVRPLMANGVLVETEVLRHPGRGRTAYTLDVTPDRYRFVGVKLTTDTVYAVLTDLRATVLRSHQAALPSLEVADVVDAVRHAVAELTPATGAVDAVGVTVGGLVGDGGVVLDSHYLGWHDVPFRALLTEALGIAVHVDNDVHGLTKVQHWFGLGRGTASFALLTVGAGIGYGLVVNHELVPTSAIAIGHYPVQPGGPLCPLAHRGCMTAMLTSEAIASKVSVGHGRLLTFDEAVLLGAGGDPVARRVIEEAAHALGRAAAAIGTMTGVERVILSGEGVHVAELAMPAVDAGLREYDAGSGAPTEVVLRPMEFLQWARGAAAVAIQAEFPPKGRRMSGEASG